VFSRAKEILLAHPGTAPVELRLGSDNGLAAPVLRSRTLKVDPSRDTIEGTTGDVRQSPRAACEGRGGKERAGLITAFWQSKPNGSNTNS
jgi:hypothetical protein